MTSEAISENKPNRLINEKSQYLLQHALNPVDWYPWKDEAFIRAKEEDKPVFVSIGYSSCHWCHVMEKESFEDEVVADLLNRAFICVKVDREERPDIDAAYMAICQAIGRNCGWPLNVILTPTKNPFFVASYIPKDNRYGTIGLLSLVPQIEQLWKTKRAELEARGIELKEQISFQSNISEKETLNEKDLDEAYDQLFLSFDHENAGFGNAPKFPSPHNLLFLLKYYNRTRQQTALEMAERTLRMMRLGGIFDQVGLGFHRYSTDAKWLVPHFEKMLYDQALLSLAYIETFQITGSMKFMVTAKETLDYVLNNLTAPEGYFYSSEDADSEGEEGKYYLWTLKEIQETLPPDLIEFAVRFFDVRVEGNYIESGKGRNGKNILHIAVPIEQMATETNLTIDQVIEKLGRTVLMLNKARKSRVHPVKDDKAIVDWNGLTIAALARSSQILNNEKYLEAAEKAGDFILKKMQTKDNGLLHRFAKGESSINAFLDDYAYLIYALIELYEADFNEKYLQDSVKLANLMLANFWDQEHGGFYFTGKNGEEGIPRMKQSYDGAIPSGNSVALHDLIRLSALTGDQKFEQYANRLLLAFSEDLKGYPMGHTFMLSGLDHLLGPNINVTLVGNLEEKDTQEMLTELRRPYLPNLTIILWTNEHAKKSSSEITYSKINGKATAYICKNKTCMPPTNDKIQAMKYILSSENEKKSHNSNS